MRTKSQHAFLLVVVLFGCSASPKINVGNERDGAVAGSGGATGFGGVGGFGGGDDTLTALITEPPGEMAIEVVTISCAGECKQVLAVATGGNDPYTFAWNDGLTTAAREICATDDTTFTVSVTDTAIVDGEFPYAAQTATATITADVSSCVGDAGTDADTDAGTCEGATVLGPITPDVHGAPTYFANGAALGAGRYRITYLDGCLRYEGPWGWSVNGLDTYRYLIIGETTTEVLAPAPGLTSTGFFSAALDYPVFDDCVAASRALPSLDVDIDFAGGRLGIWQNDFKPEDNVPGPDNRSPTWLLTRCGD